MQVDQAFATPFRKTADVAIQYPTVIIILLVSFLGFAAARYQATVMFAAVMLMWQVVTTQVICMRPVFANLSVILFAAEYLLLPPILAGGYPNYFIVAFFGLYLMTTFVAALHEPDLFSAGLSVVISGLVGAVIIWFLWSVAPSTFFVNQTNQDGEVCTMPTKQKFKCSVYKNGELVG
jgi:hypothetical protein